MALKKIFIKPGLGNYSDSLDVLEYVNQVLRANSLPITHTCCSPSATPLAGQILAYNDVNKMWEATTSSAGGSSNLALGTVTSTTIPITNSNGTGFTLPLVTSSLAGLASPAMLTATTSPNGTTYTQMVNGQMNFVVNGTTVMSLSPTKASFNGLLLDPPSGLELLPVASNPGGVAANTFWKSSANSHFYVGSLDLNDLTTTKQTSLQFKDEGSNLGASGTVDVIDFTGSAITTSRVGNTVTVNTTVPTALTPQGVWDATTNTPTLVSSTGTLGYWYQVSVAGSTTLDGNSTWNIGDSLFFGSNGQWNRVGATSGVSSVFGRGGAVVAANGDYSASLITNTPAGNISSITVQTALNELDTEKVDKTLTSTNVFVGNASNVATGVALSGDVTLTNAGVATVLSASTTQSGKVELATTAETETGTDTVRAITPLAGEATYIKKSLINAKGDLIVGTADNVNTVLSVGTNNQILTVDSSQASGLSWTSPTPAIRYTQTFLTTDWVVVGNEGTLTITQVTHGKGLYPMVRVEENIAGVFYKITVEERVAANGDITLKINTPTIAGRVIII